MAFRIQDPSSGLFWQSNDHGSRIDLRPVGSTYTQTAEGAIQNTDTGLFVNHAGSPLVEGPEAKVWVIGANGSMFADGAYYAAYSEMCEALAISTEPASWVRVSAAAAEEPVVAEEEEEPVVAEEEESEAAEEDEEPEAAEEEEDVPVARGAALIEEALSTQAIDKDMD